jgi:hypothetical protein
MRPYLKKKKKSQKRDGRIAQGVEIDFKLQHHKKKANVYIFHIQPLC